MIILTNDDGIDAPGIAALKEAVATDTTIIAPQAHLSGCGHQVTTQQAIAIEKRSQHTYAIDGTPADCVRIGLSQLSPETEWVISGINAGGNLGTDAYISGTVAAAREAAILGRKAIAISHWINKPMVIDWQLAINLSKIVLNELQSLSLPSGKFWNVNLPHLSPDSPLPEIVFCQPSTDPLPLDYRLEGNCYYYQGVYNKRDRTPGTDVDVCFSGKIAVTLLQI
ncbi:MAG: 5'/3'-nucleotidase SurE [Cyanobacteria bacterium J083]|nr:MAG: 5'/3'-nucleotidase SurE [Cyanobacteria bacterium J083]